MNVIEKYIIMLKEDLQISSTCKTIKNSLLKSINDKSLFSKELAAYFRGDPPFEVSRRDPSQVSALKKILNVLNHVEHSFYELENIDLSQGSLQLGRTTVSVAFKAVHELYSALKLLNESGVDIGNIVSPHFQKLLPKINVALKTLNGFRPDHPEEAIGALLGEAVGMLPTETITEDASLGNISQFIAQLPHYFEELQKLIATGASGIATKSVTNGKEYQEAMLANANSLKKSLKKIDSRGGVFPCMSLVSKLMSHSIDLINAAAPLTKQAYLDSVHKLEQFKHDVVPELISELEIAEESMGLKPGVLTEPVLKQIDAYYTQIANQVSTIASVAGYIDTAARFLETGIEAPESGVLKRLGLGVARRVALFIVGDKKSKLEDPGPSLSSIPDLNVLMDDKFLEKRREYQIARLNEARVTVGDKSAAEAAERFFSEISKYTSNWRNRNLGSIDSTQKKELISDYKKFQSHFAALHPHIDRLIVDALTKPSEGILTRLYNGYLKELWSSNHFKTIIECKNSVLDSIEQSIAQAKLQGNLIEKTMSEAEELPRKLHVEKEAQRLNSELETRDPKLSEPEGIKPFRTPLTEVVSPFQPITFKFEEDKSADFYHHKAIDVANQMIQLERAQSGATDFFDALKNIIHISSTLPFAVLEERTKEKLRIAYKKFQTQLLAMEPEDEYRELNAQLTRSLNSNVGLLTVEQINNLKSNVNQFLRKELNRLKQDKNDYLAQEDDAREKEYKKTPLEYKGADLERKTLFGHLNDLKLSNSFEDFLNTKFTKYLKDNLSSSVWKELSTDGETIDLTKLPFTDLYKDTPEVQMYKNIINAIYHTKVGLKDLEQLYEYGDPQHLLSTQDLSPGLLWKFYNLDFSGLLSDEKGRFGYVYKVFNALILNIIKSKSYLAQASGNPALREIMQEGLALLAPLNDIPIIGDYVEPSKTQETPKLDILEAWRQQLDIVDGVMNHKPRAKTDQELISDQINQILNEILDKLDHKIESNAEDNEQIKAYVREQVKAQFNDLNKEISSLSFGPGSVRKIMTTLNRFEKQLSTIITINTEQDKLEIPALVSQLDQIHSDLRTQLKEAAEYTEFYSGHKIGTISTRINNKINSLYKNLINNLSLLEGLKLHVKLPSDTQKIESPKRSAGIQSNSDRINAIFGVNHGEFNRLYQPYMLIKRIVDESKVEGGPSFNELKNELVKYYKILQPELVKINPVLFDKEYISKCSDLETLLSNIDLLFKERHRINLPSSPFDNLKDLFLEGNFDEPEKVQFQNYYKEIQPYLYEINRSYDFEFLRKLTRSEDIQSALREIISEENALTIPLNDTSYLQMIAENLYQIPIKLKGENVDPEENNKKIKEFIDGLSGLSFSPETLQKILKVSSKLQIQLSEMAKLGQVIATSHLKEIQSEFRTILMESADSVEFNLGLKPGSYSSIVSKSFDKFHSSLIEHLPIENDQTDLELLIGATSIQKRLTKEEGRLEKVSSDTTALETRKSIFGFEHQHVTPLYQPYLVLKKINFGAAMPGMGGMDEVEPQQQSLELANQEYQKIQPYLVEKNPMFTSDYISSCTTVSSLTRATDTLFEQRHTIHNNSSNFDKIMDLYLNSDFQKEEDKIKFLQCYAELQPNLFKIDSSYDQSSFLRELQTPEGFKGAAERILKDEIKLQEFVKGISHTNDIKKKLCEERVNYFTELLEKQEQVISPQQIEAFKEKVFNNYINANIESMLANELGQKKAELYMQQIRPEIIEKQNEILAGITLQDDIEERIAEKVNGIVSSIINAQQESLINKIIQIIEKEEGQLQADRGKIKKENPYIKDTEIESKLNQCRVEKISVLKANLEQLMKISEQEGFSALKGSKDGLTFIKTLREYDKMIELYNQLDTMQTTVNATSDYKDRVRGEKTDEIIKMRNILTNTSRTPSERLGDITAYASTKECKNTLFKNADPSFSTQCKKFFFTILSIIPFVKNKLDAIVNEENMFSKFKSRLSDIKKTEKEEEEIDLTNTNHKLSN